MVPADARRRAPSNTSRSTWCAITSNRTTQPSASSHKGARIGRQKNAITLQNFVPKVSSEKEKARGRRGRALPKDI